MTKFINTDLESESEPVSDLESYTELEAKSELESDSKQYFFYSLLLFLNR